jgi:DNA-binding transcriptional LysR family regulator
MDIRSLRYFLAVAEELHFGRAAAKLHISQPPLTLQIQNLETRLGARLFDRNQRRVRLTPAGSALVDEARRILGQIEDAARVVKRAQSGDTGRLRVGFLSSAMLTPVGERFARVRKAMPGLTDTWIEMVSSAQADALQHGLLDIGFAHTPLDLGELRSALILREPLVAVLHEGHAAAKASRIGLDALKNDSFVMFPRTASPRLHDMVVATCYDAGFSPQIAHHANHFFTMVSLVSKGLGVALVPRWMRHFQAPGAVFKPIRGAKPLVQVSILWHPKNPSPVLPKVLNLLGARDR